eukprot:TRINITY_DN94185_c0_g1_i1.p1 TRINITY_DN94185_c0_g1~~TRINITY_DN94185_c0_g1_i1.p1  ORF type:complete len:594 (+),score=99.79 TRINITY_DN94185_c0_g1_i1:36-1817(+)
MAVKHATPFFLFFCLAVGNRERSSSRLSTDRTSDELNCVEYFPEEEFQRALTSTIDPCLSCEDIIMFMEEPFHSPNMPEAVCTAGYRKKYCKLAPFVCYLGVPSQPAFCDDAMATGEGSPETGWEVKNVCQRGLVGVEQKAGVDEAAIDKYRTYLHSLFGERQMEASILADASSQGLACLAKTDASTCAGSPGCAYYEGLRTKSEALEQLARGLGFAGTTDLDTLKELFSWNTGCVPEATLPTSATEAAESDSENMPRLQWRDDSCFLDSAIFVLFGETNKLLEEDRLATPATAEAEDTCGEFIRAALRNVVAMLRTTRSVQFERYVGVFRKGLPVACHQFLEFTAMGEMSGTGKGNFESAMQILLMSMRFEITSEDLKKGLQAYLALRAGDVQGAPSEVPLKYIADYSLRRESIQLQAGTEAFDAPVYGTMLLVGRQGLNSQYSIALTRSLSTGTCATSLVLCMQESLQGFVFVSPPRRMLLGVDLQREQRASAIIPKDFGMDMTLPCEIIANAGDACTRPRYRMTAFGAGSESHQVSFARSEKGWVFHDDFAGIYTQAEELSMHSGHGYDVVFGKQFGLRTSSTTLMYEML